MSATETRKIGTSDWEIIPHIDYPTAEKVRMTELEHRCLLSVCGCVSNCRDCSDLR